MNTRTANKEHVARPRTIDEEEPPADLLQRHGARVLEPSAQDSLSSTVYRSDILLGPSKLLAARPDLLGHGSGDTDGAFNRILVEAGWFLEPEPADEQASQEVTILRVRQRSILDPENRPQRLLENRIDAFSALQVLRLGSRGSDIAKIVEMLSLDHLLFASTTVGGLPITEGHTDPDQHNEPGRSPVAVLSAPARRRPASAVPGGRRPVVAVLDTWAGAHDWLDTVPGVVVADPFLVNASRRGFVARSNETTGVSAPLVGTLDTHAGHGTFIAGIIRQVAPDACVLMLPIMHGDGIVYESTLIDALTWIRREVRSADPARFIDIVCMPFGYHEETSHDVRYTSTLRACVEDLCALGVQIVASAGNGASRRRIFPAAFADTAATPGSIVSVGALNPNRTTAIYSNQAPWVTDWEVGTRVVSTMPPFDAARSPALQTTAAGGPVRELTDEDDFAGGRRGMRVFIGGFAQWSGTSFAAGAYAGRLAQAMLEEADRPTAMPTLSPVDAASARARAQRAVQVCRA